MSQTHNNTNKVFYKKTGKGETLLLCIPGGPGFSHEYLDAFHDHIPQDQFTIVSFDPTGTGKSNGRPFHQNFEAYAKELNELVDALDFKQYYVLAHSAAAFVLFDYLLGDFSKPAGAIFINPILNGMDFNANLNKLADQLPKEFHDKRKEILSGDDPSAYLGLLAKYWFPYRFCRKAPWPEALNAGLASISMNMVNHFVGPDPLNFTGNVLDYDRKSEIEHINVPCLAITGAHDYTPIEHLYLMKENIPNCEIFIAENSSHTPWIEDEEKVFQKIIGFMT